MKVLKAEFFNFYLHPIIGKNVCVCVCGKYGDFDHMVMVRERETQNF